MVLEMCHVPPCFCSHPLRIANREAFSVMEGENPEWSVSLPGRNTERREGGEGTGGQSREAKKRQSSPAVCFPIFHYTASCWYNKHLCGVPTEASAVLVGGLNRFTCWKALERNCEKIEGQKIEGPTWIFEHFALPVGNSVTQLRFEFCTD